MLFLSLCCVVIPFTIILSDSKGHDKLLNLKWESRSTYADLLKNLVDINERRFQALNQYVASTFDWTGRPYLRTKKKPVFDRQKGDDACIIILLAKKINRFAKQRDLLYSDFPKPILNSKGSNDIVDADDKSSYEVSSSDENDEDNETLRSRNWMSSCSKNAYKVCHKSCKKAFEDACSSHDCKRSVKRSSKKECKRSCKAKFKPDTDKSSDTE